MRPLALAVVTALALWGCTSIPRVEGVAPEDPPLRVWIGFPVGGSRIHPIYVNREAHVAMFEIIPGRGATLVYPRKFEVGSSLAHWVDLSLQPGRAFYISDPFRHASHQPRYYYAVASIAPLNLTRLQASFSSMRQVLGRMYGTYRPYDVIDRLTELVVPRQSDEEWATDLIIDWPDVGMPPAPPIFTYRFVRCANGRVFPVLSDYPYYGCPGDAPLAVATTDRAKPPTKPIPVERKRPRPEDRTDIIGYSDGDAEHRRRAVGGARAPHVGRGTARSPTTEGIRYSDDRRAGGVTAAPAEPARTSAPVRDSGAESAPRQRIDPPSEPTPRGEGSGKERKPHPR